MANRFKGTEKYKGLVKNGEWTGRVNYWPADLEKPLRWKKPRRIFVNSMGDLFHPSVEIDGPIYDEVMRMVRRCPQHAFLFLTKRPEKMLLVCNRIWKNDFPRNAWFGVTAENQKRADERIPILLQIPAAVRWVSVEPLLSEIKIYNFLKPWEESRHITYGAGWKRKEPQIHWIVAGGESGPGARPMNPDWVRSLRDQCVEAGMPFHFKQWGEWGINWLNDINGKIPGSEWMDKIGKKAAGRELEGRTWDQYPAAC